MTVRIGVSIMQEHISYAELREGWVRADEMGADTLHLYDHFFPIHGDRDGWCFEAQTLLAAMAEVTNRIEIGANVFAQAYRNPHMLADMARTIDHISGGRYIIGIGAGGSQRDHDEYGYEFGTPGQRLLAMEEKLNIVRERMAKLNPPPMRHIPIFVGTGGFKVGMRIAAEHADIWNSHGGPEKMALKNEALDGWCREVGRDPSEIERSVDIWDEPHTLEYAEELLAAGCNHIITYPKDVAWDGDEGWDAVATLLAWRDQKNGAV